MEHKYSTPWAAGPIVVKYGGNAMGAGPDVLLASAVELQRGGVQVVLVHGGGPQIDRRLLERNVPTRRIDGLRVTDEVTLEVTEAVLCATINKHLVRACAALGARAVGISGEDASTLVARRAYGSRGEDLGFVGDVVGSDPALVTLLLESNYLPVVAPLAIADTQAHAYNVNADLAAAALAGALRARAFVMVTNVERVRSEPGDPSSGIEHLSLDEARAFARTPACEGGMLPKMLAAISAVERGAAASYICAPQPIEAILGGNATIVA